MFYIKDIDDYQNRLTERQKEVLLNHCNESGIYPEICAWYDDIYDFYQDWVYDHKICSTENDADIRFEEDKDGGEFIQFSNGEIIRLVL